MSGWAAAIGAAMDIANTGLGLYQSSKAYRRAKEMYQHRYQWAVDDMRKAGLNPIMAATGGGVSTAGLNAGQVGNTGNFGSNAVAAYKASQESKLMDAQTSAANSSALQSEMTADYYREQGNLARQQQLMNLQTWDANVQMKNAEARSSVFDAQMRSYQDEASRTSLEYMRKHPGARDFGNWFKLVNPFNSASSLFGSLGSLAK